MKIFKRANLLQVISLILLVIVFVLCLFSIRGMEELFWVILALNMFGYIQFMTKWSKEGKTTFKKMDENYNKNFTRKSSETIFFMCIAYFLVICIIIVGGYVFKGFDKELNVLLPLLIFSIIWNVLALIIVDKTFNQIKTLVKTKK